jgi:hypothetical protein
VCPSTTGATPVHVPLDRKNKEKAPSCVLITATYPHRPIAFGSDALDASLKARTGGLFFSEVKTILAGPRPYIATEAAGGAYSLEIVITAMLACIKNKALKLLLDILGSAEKLSGTQIR